jgi:hypothetical protein
VGLAATPPRRHLPARGIADHRSAVFGDHDRRRVGIGRGAAGMTDASMTRRPSKPRAHNSSSTTAFASCPTHSRTQHILLVDEIAAERSRTALHCQAGGKEWRDGEIVVSAMRWLPQLASLGGHAIPRLIDTLEAG